MSCDAGPAGYLTAFKRQAHCCAGAMQCHLRNTCQQPTGTLCGLKQGIIWRRSYSTTAHRSLAAPHTGSASGSKQRVAHATGTHSSSPQQLRQPSPGPPRGPRLSLPPRRRPLKKATDTAQGQDRSSSSSAAGSRVQARLATNAPPRFTSAPSWQQQAVPKAAQTSLQHRQQQPAEVGQQQSLRQIQQQQQQQQQWQKFHQPPVYADRSASGPLAVTMTGVLRKSQEFESGFTVLRFKKVKCSNGSQTKNGWEPPLQVQQATAGSLGNRTSRGSNGSSSSSKNWAAAKGSSLLAVVGDVRNLMSVQLQEGGAYRVVGNWQEDDKYGWQIRLVTCEELPEATNPVDCLTHLPGVGEKTAQSIVDHLGLTSWDSVQDFFSLPKEEVIAQLCKVPKIGPATAKKIKASWDGSKGALDQQQQLQQRLDLQHPRLITRLLQYYGEGADIVSSMSQNPYAVFRVVPGYSLEQADSTAAALGFSPSAHQRGAAYLQATLVDALDSHSGMTWAAAVKKTAAKLQQATLTGWPPDQDLRPAAEWLIKEGKLVVEKRKPMQQPAEHRRHHYPHPAELLYEFSCVASSWSDDDFVYLPELYQAEQDNIEYFMAVLQESCQALQRLQGQEGASSSSSSRDSGSYSSSSSLQLPVSVSSSDRQQLRQLERKLSEQFDKRVSFNQGQQVALLLSRKLPALALTGGPGCGKTLVSQAVARWWLDTTLESDLLYMAAPTGRAAQRLQEVLWGEDAEAVSCSTIHRLLGYRNSTVAKRAASAAGSKQQGVPDLGVEADEASVAARDLNLSALCEFNRSNPLPEADFLVDEVSMMDLMLAAALFNGLGGAGQLAQHPLMVVGDPDQLPPVGAGQPVVDALAEGMLPCVDLRQIYRTAANSAIVTNAHAINRGQQPHFSAVWQVNPGCIAADISRHVQEAAAQPGGLALDDNVLLLQLPDGCSDSHVAEVLKQVVQQLLPRLGCDMRHDVQVLSPIKRSHIGTEELNIALQQYFNPQAAATAKKKESGWAPRIGGYTLCVGDRVTHLKNDSERDVFNGDQGYVEAMQHPSVVVRYPRRSKKSSHVSSSDSDSEDPQGAFHRVVYQGRDIADMLQPAWATTVHKAQGGEFPVVILPIHAAVGRLQRRQLLYTAVSRAQRLLVIVGNMAAIQACIQSAGPVNQEKVSRFRAKLRSARVKAGLPTIRRAVFGPGGWESAH